MEASNPTTADLLALLAQQDGGPVPIHQSGEPAAVLITAGMYQYFCELANGVSTFAEDGGAVTMSKTAYEGLAKFNEQMGQAFEHAEQHQEIAINVPGLVPMVLTTAKFAEQRRRFARETALAEMRPDLELQVDRLATARAKAAIAQAEQRVQEAQRQADAFAELAGRPAAPPQVKVDVHLDKALASLPAPQVTVENHAPKIKKIVRQVLRDDKTTPATGTVDEYQYEDEPELPLPGKRSAFSQ